MLKIFETSTKNGQREHPFPGRYQNIFPRNQLTSFPDESGSEKRTKGIFLLLAGGVY